MKRLFFALPLYHEQIEYKILPLLKKQLQNQKITWVNPSQTHITIHFFGDTSEEFIPLIENTLAEATQNIYSKTIYFQNLGYFGSHSNPRVIWIGISDIKWLTETFNIIEQHLNKIECFSERKEFNPHLTIGRIKFLSDLDLFHNVITALSAEVNFSAYVNKLVLYQSILKPQGPIYIPIKSFYLLKTENDE